MEDFPAFVTGVIRAYISADEQIHAGFGSLLDSKYVWIVNYTV